MMALLARTLELTENSNTTSYPITLEQSKILLDIDKDQEGYNIFMDITGKDINDFVCNGGIWHA